MLYSLILTLLIVEVQCEWVEIAQQHYKKPLRPMHNHPFHATVGKTSDSTRPTHLQATVETHDAIGTTLNRPLNIDTAEKANDNDRVNKRNRIYINHTFTDNCWDIDPVPNVPSNVNVKLNSDTKLNEKYDVFRKPTRADEIVVHEPRGKEEVIITRRTNSDKTENSAEKTNKPPVQRTTAAGHVIRVHPTNNKRLSHKPNPIDEYKGPIEVLNWSDLEHSTAEDTLNTNIYKGIENTVKIKQSANSTKIKQELSKPDISNDNINIKPNYESTTKQTSVFNSVTNIRRVDIIRSTKPTPIEGIDKRDYKINESSSSVKPESITENSSNVRMETTTYKFPKLGNVKRVHVERNATKFTHKPKPEHKYATTEPAEDDFAEKKDETENRIRVDNTTIRRSTTAKYFPMRTKPGKLTFENRIKLNQVPTVPNPEDAMLEELIIGEKKHFDIKVHKVASIGTVKKVSIPTITTTVDKNKLNKTDSVKRHSGPTSEIETDEEITAADEDSSIHYHNISKNHDLKSSTEEPPIPTTAKLKQKQNTATKKINPQIEKYDPSPSVTISDHIPEFVTKEDNFGKIEFESTSEGENQAKLKRKEIQDNSDRESQPDTQSIKNENDRDKTEDPLSSDRKNSAMENLIKFLKTVTEIITKNTRRGVHGKIRYLEDLRDTIMANIEERLDAEFPDDDGPESLGSRRARSAEPRGHVEFPSSEGALMTISFLTFAVFLIKLVLQVIQAYKNKTMMMMPTVVAAVGRAYSNRGKGV